MKYVCVRLMFLPLMSMQVFAINFDQEIRPKIEGRWISLGVDIATNQLPNKESAVVGKLLACGALGYVHKPAQKSVGIATQLSACSLGLLYTSNDCDEDDLEEILEFKNKCKIMSERLDTSLVPLEQRFVRELLTTGIDDIATPYAIEALEKRGLSTSSAYALTGTTKLLALYILSLRSLQEAKPYIDTGDFIGDICNALYYFAYPKKQTVQQDMPSIDTCQSRLVWTTDRRFDIE